MSIAAAALRRPVTTIAATTALVLLGAVSLGRLPVSLLPDVTLPVLTIRTSYPGAAAPEASRFVAEPIEEAVAATPGLVDVRSVSRSGEVTTTLRFAWGTDIPRTVLDIRERLDNVRARLPDRADRPVLLTSDPGERPIAVLGLTAAGDLRSIARQAKDVHARRLEQLAGVASVAVVGDPKDEIRVDVDPERARSLGITPGDVATAIQNANVAAPGGTVRRGQFRYSLRALTEFQSVAQVEETPVGPARAGIRLKDIGSVSFGLADPKTLTTLDGRPAVGLVIYKDAGANTVAVTQDLFKVVDQLTKEFPETRIQLVAAQADFVVAALSNLGQEIFIGGALSLIVILLFLKDWRVSLAIGLMVPLSVMVALTLLQVMDVTINILSLGGLALGVGLLVDNAIVVAEGTGRHLETGKSREEAARIASRGGHRSPGRRHPHHPAGVRPDRVRPGAGGGALPRLEPERGRDAHGLAGAGADADAGDDDVGARTAGPTGRRPGNGRARDSGSNRTCLLGMVRARHALVTPASGHRLHDVGSAHRPDGRGDHAASPGDPAAGGRRHRGRPAQAPGGHRRSRRPPVRSSGSRRRPRRWDRRGSTAGSGPRPTKRSWPAPIRAPPPPRRC